MSEQTSKTVIGGFVVGALALVVIGVLIFGSGDFMKKTNKYVLFFEETIRGLDVGSPVAFRGVKIGSVTRVALRLNTQTMTTSIPVIIEVEPDRFEVVGGVIKRDLKRNLKKVIKLGMRAQLVTESLVTGRLMIELGMHPDTPVRLVGKDTGYPEIPTIPSTYEKFASKLSQLPIEDLFAKTIGTIDAIKELVESPEIKQSIHTLKLAMDDARKLINDLRAQVEPVATSAKGAIEDYGRLARNTDKQVEPLAKDVRKAVNDYGKLARNIDRHVDPLFTDVGEAVKVATSALKRAESTIEDIQDLVSDDSVMTNELKTTLRELSSASRSIRVWADYLERHPEALIRGKGGYRR